MSDNQNNNQQNQKGGKKSPKVAELEGRIAELRRAQPFISNSVFYNTRIENLEAELARETRKPLKEYSPIISDENSIPQMLFMETYP